MKYESHLSYSGEKKLEGEHEKKKWGRAQWTD